MIILLFLITLMINNISEESNPQPVEEATSPRCKSRPCVTHDSTLAVSAPCLCRFAALGVAGPEAAQVILISAQVLNLTPDPEALPHRSKPKVTHDYKRA